MAKKQQNKKTRTRLFDKPWFKLAITVTTSVLAALILAFSTMTILAVMRSSYEDAPKYLLWVFFFVGVMAIVIFLKERTKLNLIRAIILFVFNLSLAVIVQFAKGNPYLFSLTAGLYCLSIIVSRVFHIIQKRKIRTIVFNCILITLIVFMAIGILTTPSGTELEIQAVILIECIIIAIISFIEAAALAFSQLKLDVLAKIITNTFSLEILFGLLTLVVCFSLVFPMVEPDINTFPDALWYCFAVVTTIGFGDIAAVTGIGRVLTVVLGIYGLIVVAVITSIIVNFYNETVGKHDQKELKELTKEANDKLDEKEKKSKK